jgi:hypothetical protein
MKDLRPKNNYSRAIANKNVENLANQKTNVPLEIVSSLIISWGTVARLIHLSDTHHIYSTIGLRILKKATRDKRDVMVLAKAYA